MTTATKRRRTTGGVTLSTASLKAALAAIKPAISTRPTKPVLSGALLADGSITATDLEIQISAEIDYHGEPLLLPHARLQAILQTANGPEVSLAVEGSVCVVSVGRGVWRLPMEQAAEFPTWTPEGVKSLVRLPGDQFVRAVAATHYATDTESSRYALGAVLLSVSREDGRANFVATDGRRMSVVVCEHGQDTDGGEPLVPGHVLQAIARLASSHADSIEVQLEASDRELVATMPGATVHARLIEGKFPRWRDVVVIDRPGEQVCVINREELRHATTSAAIVTTEQSKGVEYRFEADGLHVHGKSSEAGESSITADVVTGVERPVTVKLDPTFVSDWLRGLSSENDPDVSVHVVDAESATVLTCDDCTGVIMPLAQE